MAIIAPRPRSASNSELIEGCTRAASGSAAGGAASPASALRRAASPASSSGAATAGVAGLGRRRGVVGLGRPRRRGVVVGLRWRPRRGLVVGRPRRGLAGRARGGRRPDLLVGLDLTSGLSRLVGRVHRRRGSPARCTCRPSLKARFGCAPCVHDCNAKRRFALAPPADPHQTVGQAAWTVQPGRTTAVSLLSPRTVRMRAAVLLSQQTPNPPPFAWHGRACPRRPAVASPLANFTRTGMPRRNAERPAGAPSPFSGSGSRSQHPEGLVAHAAAAPRRSRRRASRKVAAFNPRRQVHCIPNRRRARDVRRERRARIRAAPRRRPRSSSSRSTCPCAGRGARRSRGGRLAHLLGGTIARGARARRGATRSQVDAPARGAATIRGACASVRALSDGRLELDADRDAAAPPGGSARGSFADATACSCAASRSRASRCPRRGERDGALRCSRLVGKRVTQAQACTCGATRGRRPARSVATSRQRCAFEWDEERGHIKQAPSPPPLGPGVWPRKRAAKNREPPTALRRPLPSHHPRVQPA